MNKQKIEEAKIRERFKDHQILADKENDGIRYIEFGKPGTMIYKIHYIITRNVLTVFGDCYEAVYMWSSKVSLEFLAGCSLGYFAEKCRASQHGYGSKHWDSDRAKESIEWRLEEMEEEDRKKFTDLNGFDHLSTEFEWCLWLQDHGYDVFGDICELGNIGMDTSWECHAHLVGLKMINEKLTAAKAA